MTLGVRIGAFFALGITACTLIYGPSDAEFSGGKPDSGTVLDGAPTTSPTSEAGSSSDSGGTSEAGSAPFVCPAAALLCDDFENPDTNPFSGTTGNIQLANGGEGGSAHALAATLQGGQESPLVSASFNPTTAAGILDFWFKPDSVPPDNDTHFRLASLLWGAGCDWQLSWTIYIAGSSVVVDMTTYDQKTKPSCGPVATTAQNPAFATSAVVDGNWHHVSVTTDARTSHITAVTTIDQQAPLTLSLDLARNDAPSTVGIALGVPCTQTTGGCFDWNGGTWRVLYDDVSFTLPSP